MTQNQTQFVKQTSFEVEYAPSHITKWRSSRTGLQMTYINQPSPIVNGYFAVATEIENSSGCPHTLEHLVFMGSKKYPYKGLLDNLGNRLYSSTNAWTSVDQTVYTLTTAGWEGFKTLLPIYLDHLFNPTLTEEACLTEVYHIDGKGKEKGVVFSEMQGIESQSWFVSFQKMQETLYAPNSGYSSETGGLMKELRHLTNNQIKEFHKSMYRPDNLCVIITGSVEENELLEVMTEFDNELPELPTTPNKRPFVDSHPHDEPLQEVLIKEVEFPEIDESMGELLISWIGPNGNDTLVNSAIDMIGAYFTDSPISLFNKNLVEIEHPLATDIDYTTDDYFRTAINFTVNGVPTAKLAEVDTKIKDLILSQTKPENIDMKYLKQVINQQKLKFVSDTEKSPSLFSNIAILEFIYGNPDGTDLSKWTKDLQEYETMLNWTAEQWSELVKTYFVDNKSATILGKPSAKLNDLIKKQNKQLNKEIKEKYGKEGLQKLQEKLEAAQAKNDIPIPEELLTKFSKPDPSKVEFIKTKSYNAGYTKSIVDNNTNQYIQDDKFSELLTNDTPADFPLFIHLEDFKSQFTTIKLIMSSTRIDPQLLSYMSIMEELFSLSIQLPDEYIPYEKVISEINNDLIEFQLDNGYENQFLELIGVNIKFESTKYQKAIDWLLKVTRYTIFEESRVKVIIEKIINSLPDKKRNGELMMYSSQYRHMFEQTSLRKAQDAIFTELFYKDLLEQIDQGNFAKIQQDLNTLRQQLFKLDNIKVFILGNTSNLKSPVSAWTKFTQECLEQDKQHDDLFTPEPFAELPRSYQFRSDIGDACNKEAYFVNIPAAESTHLMSLTKIPTNYLEDDIFKIALASEFLTAVEGPFWRGIRGTGLAYGANIRRDIETGYLSFSIYRGSDAKQAWLTAKEIVEKYASKSIEIDDISIENCIAVIVNECANSQENNYEAANFKITDNVFKRRGPNYYELFLKKLNKLTADDIVYALNKYFVNLFKPETSVVFTSLPPDKAPELAEHFHEVGFNVNFEEIASDDHGEVESEEEEEEEHTDEESDCTDSESEEDDED
ncbi:uncharacterized protein SPAPADRAFT_57410 [Spathaspora passalidarum NRRL Y-27907]|uniref:Mitochondrial presequence protease n=1 Tax=Spathaspora passalidarum (strain NRRL Y-27907 / 11-Y1) TaxID=619300 RepID=G3AVA2_SPAPN|nr:uncharacterized protein SPAPADRAFT_57410 [Spathaspora passalidarum NRRL Y-27907]EGW29905.1 hypothetical protein SPAPADRAFT_57410 [Spathaspora passalidarum NRRL Y-27907]